METSEHVPASGFRPASRQRTPSAYRVCDGITEAALYFMVVFAPWSFGTTERWSIWTMNIAGYALGALLLVKWWVGWRASYRPARWESRGSEDGGQTPNPGSQSRDTRAETPDPRPQTPDPRPQTLDAISQTPDARNPRREMPDARSQKTEAARLLTVALAALTIAILAFCLISAVNARASFVTHQMAFVPHDYIAWLPHSYDRWATWQAFWMYLGLAFTFWSARDWLLGRSARERQEARGEGREPGGGSSFRASHPVFVIPARLRRLLWVLCLNGALLALEGILQRLSGTNKLLWLVQPIINQYAESQFGPYAYRSNAAQYLNLLWPVCLGFWWTLRQTHERPGRAGPRVGGGPHVLLLPCAVLMAAAPIITTSRGGAIVAAGGMPVALALLMFTQRKGHWLMRLGIVFLFAIALGLAGYLGWEKLAPRLKAIFSDDLSGRVEIYRNAEQMARDFPAYGTGPGTFPWVYHLYRAHAQAEWAAYAHNDWLETRITFGRVGFALVLAALVVVLLRWFGRGGIRAHWLFVSLIWLALAGCLLHARFDFPFQIYSTLALFLLLCDVLFCVSRKA